MFGVKLPDQLAVVLTKTIDNAVLGGCVNFAFENCGRRIGVRADTRFPNCLAVAQVETKEITLLGANINAVVDDRKTTFHRTEPLSLIDQTAVSEIQAVKESVFAAEVDAV